MMHREKTKQGKQEICFKSTCITSSKALTTDALTKILRNQESLRVVTSSDTASEHSKTQKNLLQNKRHACIVLPNNPLPGEELTSSQLKLNSTPKLKNALT